MAVTWWHEETEILIALWSEEAMQNEFWNIIHNSYETK